jgi:hypothetical protein
MIQPLDYIAARRELESEEVGYFVIPELFDVSLIEAYQQECAEAFDRAPQRKNKIYVPGATEDYVSPWLYDEAAGRHFNHRLYQFLDRPRSAGTTHLFKTILDIRDRLEDGWPENQAHYESIDERDYVIVTKYEPGVGHYPRHSDCPKGHSAPLLQSLILLSEAGSDYDGGDLIIHGARRGAVRVQQDLGLKKGDLLIFDKRLEHEVEGTKAVAGSSIGRWTALVGAKIKATHDEVALDEPSGIRSVFRRALRRLRG